MKNGQFRLTHAVAFCLIATLAYWLAFNTRPVTVYVRKPISAVRKDIGKGFMPLLVRDLGYPYVTADAQDTQLHGARIGAQPQQAQPQGGTPKPPGGNPRNYAVSPQIEQPQQHGGPSPPVFEDWTWVAFADSVNTAGLAGAAAGAVAGAVAGSAAGGIGALPGATAGAGVGAVGGWLSGAVTYAYSYFTGSVQFQFIYILPERALDFPSPQSGG